MSDQTVITSQDAQPHSVEAEQQILGALLSNNARSESVVGVVEARDFFDPVHGRIFGVVMEQIALDRLASPVTLKALMGNDAGLRDLGGPRYLARLVAASVASFAVRDYAKLVAEMARRREILALCDEVRTDILADGSAESSTARMEAFLQGQAPTSEPRTMSLIKAHTGALQDVMDVGSGNAPSIPTGLATLDAKVSQRRQRYTILAGSTSMGKTAVALWLALQAAKAGHGVGFVSLEMPERDLAARLNSIDSGVPYKAFERQMSEGTMNRVIEAAKAQSELPIEIFSSRVRTIPAIMAETRKLKTKWTPGGSFMGLGLLVVDYIQLVRGEGRSFEVLSEAANELKQIAKRLDLHVIALAQIDRQVMARDNTRPGLSDLRGSGDLENAPDNVIFCHREEYFLERKPKPQKADELADYMADLEASRGKMELIIAKARMGDLGIVRIGCDMGTNRFWDLSDGQEEIAF